MGGLLHTGAFQLDEELARRSGSSLGVGHPGRQLLARGVRLRRCGNPIHRGDTGAAVSRHLSVLREADLIRDKREGKFIYYELNASVLEEIMLWITDLKGASDNEGNDTEK